jgi:hypothetical protein
MGVKGVRGVEKETELLLLLEGDKDDKGDDGVDGTLRRDEKASTASLTNGEENLLEDDDSDKGVHPPKFQSMDCDFEIKFKSMVIKNNGKKRGPNYIKISSSSQGHKSPHIPWRQSCKKIKNSMSVLYQTFFRKVFLLL